MPDALAHLCLALCARPWIKDPKARALWYFAALAPDIITKTWFFVFQARTYSTVVFQTPLGWAPWAFLLALFFPQRDRVMATTALLLGGWLHILLDGVEYTFPDRPQLRPLAPFDFTWHGFPLVQNEWSLGTLTPFLVLAALVVNLAWWGTMRRKRSLMPT